MSESKSNPTNAPKPAVSSLSPQSSSLIPDPSVLSTQHSVLIIGGGAAGLLAAWRAAECGARVTILEKMDRPGRKLAITGKGRGNLTTGHDLKTALAAFGPNGKFLRGAFSRFFNEDLISLLESFGIAVTMEQGRRVFPLSLRAKDVVEVLIRNLTAAGVDIVTDCKVLSIKTREGAASGVETTRGVFPASRVILATGGASYPGTGSTGDGYRLAMAVGHSIVKPSPALVPIEFHGDRHNGCEGLLLKNVNVTLRLDGRPLRAALGELYFTTYGAAGSAALDMGKDVAMNLNKGELTLSIDFKPGLTDEQLDRRLQRDFADNGSKALQTIMNEIVPRPTAYALLRASGLPPDQLGCQITQKDRAVLLRLLRDFSFPIKGTRSLDEALVTAGGVALGEVSPKTMESKLVTGLFLCGEVLDLDAETGGFNLQAAFSTGWIAGENAAKE